MPVRLARTAARVETALRVPGDAVVLDGVVVADAQAVAVVGGLAVWVVRPNRVVLDRPATGLVRVDYVLPARLPEVLDRQVLDRDARRRLVEHRVLGAAAVDDRSWRADVGRVVAGDDLRLDRVHARREVVGRARLVEAAACDQAGVVAGRDRHRASGCDRRSGEHVRVPADDRRWTRWCARAGASGTRGPQYREHNGEAGERYHRRRSAPPNRNGNRLANKHVLHRTPSHGSAGLSRATVLWWCEH